MTGCAEYGPEVSAYLDEGLAAEERGRVEQHLAGCASCAALLSGSRELDRALRELPRSEPSASFEARLRARLSMGPAAAPRWRRRGTWVRLAGVAAAATAAVWVAPGNFSLGSFWMAPGGSTLSEEEWELIADEESFDLMLSEDQELVDALDVLETWDEREEI